MNFFIVSCAFVFSSCAFVTFGLPSENISSKTLSLPGVTDTGAIQQLIDPPTAAGLDFHFYNLFTSFVNQTRSTIPDIVHHGNYTLIQLALLGAIGAMAAGVATIIAEAKYFKEEADSKAGHEHGPPSHYGLPAHEYGAPAGYHAPPAHSYGAPSSSYGSPSKSYYEYNNLSARKKRDVNSSTTVSNVTLGNGSNRPWRKRVKKKKIVPVHESQLSETPDEHVYINKTTIQETDSYYDEYDKAIAAKILTADYSNTQDNAKNKYNGNMPSFTNYDDNSPTYQQQFESGKYSAANSQQPNQYEQDYYVIKSQTELYNIPTNYQQPQVIQEEEKNQKLLKIFNEALQAQNLGGTRYLYRYNSSHGIQDYTVEEKPSQNYYERNDSPYLSPISDRVRFPFQATTQTSTQVRYSNSPTKHQQSVQIASEQPQIFPLHSQQYHQIPKAPLQTQSQQTYYSPEKANFPQQQQQFSESNPPQQTYSGHQAYYYSPQQQNSQLPQRKWQQQFVKQKNPPEIPSEYQYLQQMQPPPVRSEQNIPQSSQLSFYTKNPPQSPQMQPNTNRKQSVEPPGRNYPQPQKPVKSFEEPPSYYMNRPYANINSNKRIAHHNNYILSNKVQTTTASSIFGFLNPFALKFPTLKENRKVGFFGRS